EIIAQDIESEDWENEWKKYYKPIKTKNITVVPGWIDYTPSDGEKIIRLDPGKAFGTGEHATTRMCLELMPDVKGKKVLDIGCGSGILGISAKLCGADDVYMCDLDPDSVEFSKQNADINGVELTVEKADLLEKTELKGDVIFANITADILIRLSEGIIKHLNDGATVILSGIIESREDDVKKAYEKLGLKLMDRMEEGDWRALKYLWR
ncbi:MAG: 50S ribosomal protein L11 methyltransferase, partial [Clostridiales bacterium]|nr:50S ribosomal protein L11 methyltransferase [Clostridiales bacterium]